jgi:hypothetical protein
MKHGECSSIRVILEEAACRVVCDETAATVRCKNRLVQWCSVKQQWTNTNKHKDHNWQTQQISQHDMCAGLPDRKLKAGYTFCRQAVVKMAPGQRVLGTGCSIQRPQINSSCDYTPCEPMTLQCMWSAMCYGWMMREERVSLKTTSWNQSQY